MSQTHKHRQSTRKASSKDSNLFLFNWPASELLFQA